jgi:hypothetical protein
MEQKAKVKLNYYVKPWTQVWHASYCTTEVSWSLQQIIADDKGQSGKSWGRIWSTMLNWDHLSSCIQQTWTKSLLNGSKIPSGLLLPSPYSLGVNHVVYRMSQHPGLCCLFSDHLPSCSFCQQTEVSERNRQTLISLLPLVSISSEIFDEDRMFHTQLSRIWRSGDYLWISLLTSLPSAITENSWG